MAGRVAQAHPKQESRPAPELVRGTCPQCGGDLVSKCYYVEGRGYLIVWECWESIREERACTYRRVL